MKSAILDIVQAVGCWCGAWFAAGVLMGFIEGAAGLDPPGVLYENIVVAGVVAVPGFAYAMISISRWRRPEHRDDLLLTDEAESESGY